MILTDREIVGRSDVKHKPLISPFIPNKVRVLNERKVISYGLDSFGYDVRLSSDDLKLFSKDSRYDYLLSDPKSEENNKLLYVKPVIRTGEDGSQYVVLPKGTGLLGHTVEQFNMGNNLFGMVMPKSSYARLFINAIVTPLQPGWSGDLVLEIVNNSCYDCKIYLDEGICQIIFFEGEIPDSIYNGVYQNQTGTQEVKL